MKKILFIYAHLDDESILSYGTICKLAKNANIYIAIVCGKGRKNLSAIDINKQKDRLQAFISNCQQFNYKLFQHEDITLTQSEVKNDIQRYVNDIKPDVVFSHFLGDLHYEHRLVAEEIMLACRLQKNSSIKALYTTVSPTIAQTFGQKQLFNPNYFVDISDYIEQKKQALARYNMELPVDNNDIRSSESIIAQNRQYGRLMNTGYCEAYQQIFKLA